MPDQSLRHRLDNRFRCLKSERSHWEDEWRLIQKFVVPRRGRINPTDRVSGRGRHRSIINSTASKALRDLSAGLATAVINPATPWFRLSPEDDELEEFGDVRAWLDKVEKRANQILTAGGFYGAATVALSELAAFGTACLACEPNFDTVRRWHPFTIGEFYLANGADGRATSVYREWQMTVEAMVATFGKERCSLDVQQAWNTGNLDKKFTVRHAIEPMSDRFAGRPGLQRWAYASVYWEASHQDGDKFLRVGGNSYCPAHAVRWEHVPPDAYGQGPVAHALGDIAALQSVERDMTVGARHKMNPAIQGPGNTASAGVIDPTRIEAGQFYPVRGAETYQPVIDPRSFVLTDGRDYMLQLEDRIRRTMFVDLFLMFAENDRRQPLTATEVIERAREKQLIGPVLHNINGELLKPTIDTVVSIIFEESAPFWARGEAGMVPPPPEEIQDAELKVEFVGELQQSLRLAKAEPIYRLAAFAGEFAQIDPTLPMKIDPHQMVDELARAWGVPPRTVRDDETVAAMMQEQAQQQAAAQAQQRQLADAETVAKLGKVSTEPGTLVGDATAMAGAV
jgi:hypothetical protein